MCSSPANHDHQSSMAQVLRTPHLPAELKEMVVQELDNASLSSISLVWRESWRSVRVRRFKTLSFDSHNNDTFPYVLRELVAIISAVPVIGSYARRLSIDLTHESSSSEKHSSKRPLWHSKATTCENLVTLLAATPRLEEMELADISSTNMPLPQRLALRDVLRAQQGIKQIKLKAHTFLTGIFDSPVEFLVIFPKLEVLDSSCAYFPRLAGKELTFANLQQHSPSNPRLRELIINCEDGDDELFLRFLAQSQLFPRVQYFRLSYDKGQELVPILRNLLMQWASSLVELDLSNAGWGACTLSVRLPANLCILL